MFEYPTPEEVKEYREKACCGMMQAKGQVMKRKLHDAIGKATTVEELRELLLIMLDNTRLIY